MRFSSMLVYQSDQGTFSEGEGLGTVDLLVLTSLDQLIFIMNILFTFVTKQAKLLRGQIVLSLFPSVSVPWSDAFFFRIGLIG
jgi:hypothetical protein